MIVLGLDPGWQQSALTAWDGERVDLSLTAVMSNEYALDVLQHTQNAVLVIEKIESFGMAVGKEVFRTVFWSGRFAQAWAARGLPWAELGRKDIKLHVCGQMRATDSNIRQALIDRIGPIGTKKNPGPLYGVKGHEFAALAVAVTYHDLHSGEIRPGIQAQF